MDCTSVHLWIKIQFNTVRITTSNSSTENTVKDLPWNHSYFQESHQYDCGEQRKIDISAYSSKVKVFTSLVGHNCQSLSCFHSMKRLGVLLLPLDGMLVHCRLPQYPQCRYPFILLGGERHCECKVSCPRTQHNDPGQCSNPDRLIQSPTH